MNALFRYAIPRWLSGGRAVHCTLAKIHQAVQASRTPRDAIRVLEESKSDLNSRLIPRFGSPVSEALTLKMLNLLLGRYHFERQSTTVLSHPYGIAVDPSNMCRLACPGCVHSNRSQALGLFDWPNGTLTETRYKLLLDRYGPHAVGIYFCNYGEPLLNLNTPKLIRMAKAYLLRTALSTSLSVQRFDAEAYVESGLDFMGMAIDGATNPFYQRYRRNGDIELVYDNVRKLVEAKRRRRRNTPVLSWNFLAFDHNVHEIPLAARTARSLGVDQFQVIRPFAVSWDDPQIHPADVDEKVSRMSWLSMLSQHENWNPFPKELNRDVILREFENPWRDLPSGDTSAPEASGHTCHWLYKNIVMDATGRILPCCCGPTPDSNLVFGNIDNGGDLFNSDRHQQARAWFRGVRPAPSDAPYCTRCDWNQTNVNVSSSDIWHYFRTAAPDLFDRASIRCLWDW